MHSVYPNTYESWQIINAITEPKNVWDNGHEIHVRTGADLPPELSRVPASIDPRQGEQVLILHGLLQTVLDAIAAIPDPTNRALVESWFYRANSWERSHVTLAWVAAQAGLTEQQIDDLFIEGSRL